MFLGSRFHKSIVDHKTIEYRERLSTLIFICLFDMAIVGVLVWLSSLYFIGPNPFTTILIAGSGTWAMVDGVLPLFIQRRIVIDRKRKVLFYTGGVARFLFKTLEIPITSISNIVIKETFESFMTWSNNNYHGLPAGKDMIYLAIRGRNDIRIDVALDERYINAFANDLSEQIGCSVVTRRF